MAVSNLQVNIAANPSGLTSALGSVGSALGGFASRLTSGFAGVNGAISAASSLMQGNFVGAVGQATSSVIDFGQQAVSSAAGFQQSMLKNEALAGLSGDAFQSMSNQILALAPQIGQAPKQLADGLYNVLSAGVPASDAMMVLKDSAEAAATGMTDTQTITDGLTSAMNAMSIPFSQTNNVMADLTATVSAGKMSWQNLASSVGMLSVTAHESGVSLQDATAGLATMTDSGMSAQRASQDLDFLMRDLGMNVDKVAKSAKGMGLSFDLSKFKTLDLMGKLQYLQQITHGNDSEMMKLTGGAVGMAAAQAILTNRGQLYSSTLDKISAAYKQGTMTQDSFKTTQEGLNQQLAQLNAAWQTLLVTVGTKFLPLLTPLVGQVTSLVSGFTQWMTTGNAASPMLSNIAGMFGIMASNWQTFTAQLQASLGGPLHQFGMMIGSLLPGFLSQFLRALDLAQLAFQDVATAASTLVGPALTLLGQILKGVQGVIETVLNGLEGQFLPAMHNLLTAIAPIIAGIVQWVASSNILGIAFNVLSVGIGLVITVVSLLINIIAGLVTFFSQNVIGVALFQAALIILGTVIAGLVVGAIISLISLIPGLVVGFGLWAAAAWATAIANIIAFGPIILIALAIIAVITLVVLAVTHWGEIAHWLQGVWAGIVTFFTGLWQGIQGVFAGIGGWFQTQFGNARTASQNGWNGTVSFFQGVGKSISSGWQSTVNAVVGAFQWLYNHNYYFKDLVDIITQLFKAQWQWLVSAWAATATWLTNAWNALAAAASATWNAMTGATQAATTATGNAIQTGWNAIVAFMSPILSAIGSAIAAAWNAVSSATQAAWNAVVGWVAGAWHAMSSMIGGAWNTYIAGPLGGIGTSIGNWFAGLGNQALQWGKNLIQQLINGINSMLGAVGQAASNVASSIWSFLGFHSPAEKGPGSDADKWAPNLLKMFNEGLQEGQPALSATLNTMLAPHVYPTGVGAGSGGTGAGSSTTQSIHLMIDGREFATAIVPHVGAAQYRYVQLRTGVRG